MEMRRKSKLVIPTDENSATVHTPAPPPHRSEKLSKEDNKNQPIAVHSIIPLLFILLPLALIAGLMFNMIRIGALPPSLARQMIATIPMHLVWTFCMFHLNGSMAAAYDKKAPFTAWQLSLISVLAFLTIPLSDGYHLFTRWADPSFAVWLVSQIIFFARAASWIDRNENPNLQRSMKFAIALSFCANAYIFFFSIFSPGLIESPLVMSMCWFVCQFMAFLFLSNFLCGRAKHPAGKSESRFPEQAARDTIIRFREFAGIERWLKQRLSPGSIKVKTPMSGLFFFFAPALAALVISCALPFVSAFKAPDSAPKPANAADSDPTRALLAEMETAAKQGPPDPKAGKECLDMMFSMLAGVGITVGGTLLYYVSKPAFLALDDRGLRFLWGRKRKNGGRLTQWKEIESIKLNRLTGTFGFSSEILVFKLRGGNVLKLPLSAIESAPEREAILRAIQTYAPLVERDTEVIECLQQRADHSYTELWLQALTAPPQRERLQPLIEGAQLQDDKYRVLRSLGVGGQGQAYLATGPGGTNVVLKEFILPVYVDVEVRKSALEQFQNEARILRGLDHERIVKLIDYFIEDHRAYLVLEHIDGSSLRELVQIRGKVPERMVRHLTAQMCQMLAYLHGLSPPVVHRDFTPDNLILTKDGRLTLIDFNVAKQVEDSTAVGTVVGKHAYLPPEQFRGEPVTASDIYAMGGTLQFLLTGVDPEPVSMSSPAAVEPGVSPQLDAIVRKATALNVNKRYANIHELEADLINGNGPDKTTI